MDSVSLTSKQSDKMKYVVISPVRNEAQYINLTLQSMVNQTVKPSEWVIVNDASTDETADIVASYAQDHNWLKLITKERRVKAADRQRGRGVIDTFYFGRDKLTVQDYSFIIKLDGDVAFEPNYFEFLLDKFAENSRLGIAGGGLYEQKNGEDWTLVSAPDHVGGPAKMYRRSCIESIGGIVPALGWDGFDEWQALALGWDVRSFDQLKIFHHRIMGNATGSLKSKIEQGYGAHCMGYHPLYTVVRGLGHISTPPYLLGGLAMIVAHFVAWSQGQPQLPAPSIKRFIQQTQLKQLAGLIRGKRVYKNGLTN